MCMCVSACVKMLEEQNAGIGASKNKMQASGLEDKMRASGLQDKMRASGLEDKMQASGSPDACIVFFDAPKNTMSGSHTHMRVCTLVRASQDDTCHRV
jgi:hypothetical protein